MDSLDQDAASAAAASSSSLTLENLSRAGMVLFFIWLLTFMQRRQSRIQRASNLQIHAARKFRERNLKRKEMHEAITKDGAYALPDEDRSKFLLSLTATELHRHMHVVGDVTCTEVVALYCLRSMAIGAITNAVTEEFATEALEQAALVDARIAARKRGEDASTPGIMEGIPISVKDAFDQRGADSSCGFAVRCFKPQPEDGLIVSLLRDAGAIPYTRTNVPQALMVPESMNVIWGATANPWNLERTPGGSSGGEGALLAARGSVLGVGSDIGGSLRIPAHFCGLYTLKPTPARMTLQGMAIPCLHSESGQIAVRPVAGPMAHSVDDLLMMLRAWFVDRMWKEDAFIPRMPLDEAVISGATGPKKLKIGYYETDGWFDPAPACSRAVRQAVAALQELGHECVRWTPPAVPLAVRSYYGIMSADSAQGVISGLEGENIDPSYGDLLLMLKVPSLIRAALVAALRSPMISQLRAALMLSSVHPKSSEELFDYHALMIRFIDGFTTAWQEQGFDAVISPGLGMPALLHGGSRELTPVCSYTFMWNVLHYPVGVVPIGLTERHECAYESATNDLFTKAARATVAGSEGLPVGVQVAALPWRDETVLRVMKELERKIQFKEIPSMANTLQIASVV